jgi:glycosyltransferase involved in cell wall biosynthesis
MRVLYVNQWGGLGGAEISLLRVLERLRHHSITPMLACPPGDLAEGARALGVTVLEVEFPALRRGRRLREEDACRLREAVARADLVHAYSVRVGWFAGRLCDQMKVPMVWSVHDLFAFPWQRMWLRGVAQRYAQAVVAYSQAIQRQFGKGLDHKLHYIPHGVDPTLFSPQPPTARAEVRKHFHTAADVPVIVHVGRIMPFKGQHLFLRMARRLRSKHPQAVFWLAGDATMGDWRYARKVKAMSTSLSPQVRWLGFQHDIARVLGAADVLVHCSTRPEPFGLVILEAMACGTAVVSANSGGPREIIENGQTGLLTPSNNSKALAAAVCTLLVDAPRRYKMAAAARQKVCDAYTLDQHVQRLLALYKTLS